MDVTEPVRKIRRRFALDNTEPAVHELVVAIPSPAPTWWSDGAQLPTVAWDVTEVDAASVSVLRNRLVTIVHRIPKQSPVVWTASVHGSSKLYHFSHPEAVTDPSTKTTWMPLGVVPDAPFPVFVVLRTDASSADPRLVLLVLSPCGNAPPQSAVRFCRTHGFLAGDGD